VRALILVTTGGSFVLAYSWTDSDSGASTVNNANVGGRSAVSPWSGFGLYLGLGVLLVLSLVSIGWLLLGPLLLVIGLSLFSRSLRRGIGGLAVGAGVTFLFLAAIADGGSYATSFAMMGIPLVCVGVLEQIRRVWVAPVPKHTR
jgi:hypothetical protein